MAIVKNLPLPERAGNLPSTSPLLDLNVGDAWVESVADIDVADNVVRARNKIQARVTYFAKTKGMKFSIRVIREPTEGVAVNLPAIAVWRIA